jgi:hypothetical protein
LFIKNQINSINTQPYADAVILKYERCDLIEIGKWCWNNVINLKRLPELLISKYRYMKKITSLTTRHAKSYYYNTYNSNKNVHIKFNAHDALKEKPSPGTLNIKRLSRYPSQPLAKFVKHGGRSKFIWLIRKFVY